MPKVKEIYDVVEMMARHRRGAFHVEAEIDDDGGLGEVVGHGHFLNGDDLILWRYRVREGEI